LFDSFDNAFSVLISKADRKGINPGKFFKALLCPPSLAAQQLPRFPNPKTALPSVNDNGNGVLLDG